ncbi:hypothetical protein BCR42DRAFT_322403 [Absidia repens]|uniref:Uncharacterized protein n=1 Tax=Absidia repens TaxID=90262 RepID=A0A1X2ISA0_9FUNG|nr:hypothetical protein BCR42DRAFT_322403 [Absidia repens]
MTYAGGCQDSDVGDCDGDYQVTKDCCAATQGAPISFSEMSHQCANIFGNGINWDKFAACCKSRGKTAKC